MTHFRSDLFHPLRGCLWAALAAVLVISPTPAAGSGEPAEAPIATILDVAAQGLDVHATLRWESGTEAPEVASLVVRDAWCGLASAAVVHGGDSATQAVVSGALDDVEKCGFQYHAVVESLDGKPLSEPFPFQVGLTCGKADCAYRLIKGVVSDGAILISDELDAALDKAAAAGGDLFENARQLFPELADEIDTYLFQLDLYFSHHEGGVSSACGCHWTVVAAVTGPLDCGWWHEVGAHANVATLFDQSSGSTSLTMKLSCLRRVKEQFVRCDPPCKGQVTHDLSFTGKAYARRATGYGASASTVAEYLLDNSLALRGEVIASRPAQVLAQTDDLLRTVGLTAGGAATTATLATVATAEVEGPQALPDSSVAVAATGGDYTMEATGTASCAFAPEFFVVKSRVCDPLHEIELAAGKDD